MNVPIEDRKNVMRGKLVNVNTYTFLRSFPDSPYISLVTGINIKT